MNALIVLAILAGLGIVWNIVTTLRIYENLRRRKVPVSFIWLRVLAPKYAHQYKKITVGETGRPGPLYYQWIISINLALVLAAAAIIVRIA